MKYSRAFKLAYGIRRAFSLLVACSAGVGVGLYFIITANGILELTGGIAIAAVTAALGVITVIAIEQAELSDRQNAPDK